MSSLSHAASSAEKRTNARYWIVVMLFIVTSFNYGDRATLSIAGSEMAKDIGLDPVGMGYVFSAFHGPMLSGRSRAAGCWTALVPNASISGLFSFGQSSPCCRVLSISLVVSALLSPSLRFVSWSVWRNRLLSRATVALLQPGSRRRRGERRWPSLTPRNTLPRLFFAPIMGWLTHEVGWSHVFFFMGGLGIIISFIWLKVIHEPNNHPGVNKKELEYIAEGGALINMDQKDTKAKVPFSVKWGQIKQLLGSRMMIGVYIGQYCINALTYFFITWFPVYLVQARGMSILKAGFVASVPAVCGFIGGVLGGIISDWLMRRTGSLNIARKTPIVLGMLLSMVMVFCNYVNVEWMIIGFMALAFFGKGIGALGWAVMADTAPKEISGLSGGLFNMFGNISGIVTPIAIGYIVGTTGSFNGALIYVGVHAWWPSSAIWCW